MQKLKLSEQIVNKEAKTCDFEFLGYMLLYPEYKIDKFQTKDLSEIYIIKHKKSNEEFRFALRGCVPPTTP